MSASLAPKATELLAFIVLRAPLTAPRQEIRLSLEQGFDGIRGAYPVLTPAAILLRRDATARPGKIFAKVAAKIGRDRYVLNRQRLGVFLAAICLREDLASDLGPVLAELILRAPDSSEDFVGPAQMILAGAAEDEGDDATAARLYAAASRAFGRGVVPDSVARSFLGVAEALAGYHPTAALAARASICQARIRIGRREVEAAKIELSRARDLAEGDQKTVEEIETMRRALQ